MDVMFCPSCTAVFDEDATECAGCKDAEGGCPLRPIPWRAHQLITELCDEVHRLQAERDGARSLLERWRERGFPMGGSELWDDTLAFLDGRGSAQSESPEDPK